MTLTQINKAGLDDIALDHVFTIGANGVSAYTFQGEGLNGTVNNPTLYLTRGKTYRFENGTGAHAIRIQSADDGTSGTLYNTGVTNNNTTGTVIVEVQHDAPDVLYYQCANHANMKGILYITGALADGGVTTAKIADGSVTSAKIANSSITSADFSADCVGTAALANNAVTTAKIANANVTTAKIANNAINSDKIATNAVNTTEIADTAVTLAKLEHGTSSNNGKFLRANNGADPTFETITGTTINNNADNRVITGSGTANTLEGEANLTYDGSKLTVQGDNGLVVQTATAPSSNTDPAGKILFSNSSNDNVNAKIVTFRKTGTSGGDLAFFTRTHGDGTNTEGEERMRIDSSGNVGIGMTPAVPLHVTGSTADTLRITNGSNTSIYYKIGRNHLDGKLEFRGTQSGDEAYSFGGVNGEKIRFQPAGGISFNGDTATANALDDYEEGTWVPTIKGPGGTGTHGAGNAGFYTKVGNVVHVHATVHWTAISGATSGVVQILGLPYATKGTSHYRSTSLLGGQVVGVHNGNNASMNIAIGVDANQSFVYVTGVNGSTTGSYNYTHQPTVNSTGQIFGFAMTYLT